MLVYRWTFEAGGRRWRVRVDVGMQNVRTRVFEDETVVAERTMLTADPDLYEPQDLLVATAEGPLQITNGYLDWIVLGCVARLGEAEVFRSSRRPFARFPRLQKMLRDAAASPEERAAMAQRNKQRLPSIIVDVAMAVVFFLIAQAYGLTAAAVSGAGITLVLFVVQRFVKVDLLGGFAVFGVMMSLLSAGAALAFQSDLAVKLRGAVIGLIAAIVFLIDGALGGRYLGKRLVGYLEMLLNVRPARAALAVGTAGVVIACIDLAAAFLLSTDLWLVYNVALDGLIAAPIVFAALWIARERNSP
jgi:intracellular septation protein A